VNQVCNFFQNNEYGGMFCGFYGIIIARLKKYYQWNEVERKASFNLEFVNSVPRFTGHQLDIQAYPPDSLGDKI